MTLNTRLKPSRKRCRAAHPSSPFKRLEFMLRARQTLSTHAMELERT